MLITARDARLLSENDERALKSYSRIREELECALNAEIVNSASDGKRRVEVIDLFERMSVAYAKVAAKNNLDYSPKAIRKYAAELLIASGFEIATFLSCEKPALNISW